ncbi:lipase [Actinoplanes sp. OR16]|uniref:alpha/beta hydrolase n=1 Tax=Actinoplanes sp. OR16 TaxID=946334 RepID=UPI000F6EE541|nr:alpha/beta hydrolase [Actinoplanes sp. OR16]BBH71684.1 lipase [Actinoplanes sp. OR16]
MLIARRKLFALLTGVVLGAAGLSAPAAAHPVNPLRPVVFVHGSAGSAMQFRTQAKRLAGNGYPARIIEAHEYDSPNIATILPQVYAGLDARIDRLLAETGADRVDLLAHSLGTFVMQGYLNSSPARAAKVAHYVNLDGRPAAAQPGGVPTLAIWGEGDPARTVAGATNVSFPDQSHTQTVSSVETFREFYRFFTGRSPRTTALIPDRHPQVSGRAVLFPSNAGVEGATVEVYPLDPRNGHRLTRRPVAVRPVAADGAFAPIPVDPRARYEFALVRAGQAVHHFYFEPFRRTDTFLRLLTSRPGEGIGALVQTSDKHTALTFQRQKEWWGAEGDSLVVNGTNILNGATAPRAKRVIGVFAFDAGLDRTSQLAEPLPEFFAITFMTGIDHYIPARGTTSIVVRSRGGGITYLPIPAWKSSDHRVSLEIDDY